MIPLGEYSCTPLISRKGAVVGDPVLVLIVSAHHGWQSM